MTDEGKVGQILRNFLTNAVKFTERGEIRVSARPDPKTRSSSRSKTRASASRRLISIESLKTTAKSKAPCRST